MGHDNNFRGRIASSVALALLESLRAADTPADEAALHEAVLPLNLRRRLGLSSVIEGQIRRYSDLGGDGVSAHEVASLFELISRREDATHVFSEAGRRLAQTDLGDRRLGARLGARALPHGAREHLAWRRVRRIARSVSPKGRVQVKRRPAKLVVEECLPARAVQDGSGCSLLHGAIERILDEYRAGGVRIVHEECESRAEERCLWRVEANGSSAS
jgi:predicted hydrocarbon binding protein